MTREEIQDCVWIADSGASTHMYRGKGGYYDDQVRESNNGVQAGEEAFTKVTKIGKWRGHTINGSNNKRMGMSMDDILNVPRLKANLFSLTKILEKGRNFHTKDGNIYITSGDNNVICFDKRIETKHGFLLATIIKPRIPRIKKGVELANPILSLNTRNLLKDVHNIICHAGEERTRDTTKKLGVEITSKMDKCEDCMVAKAKQKGIRKGVTKTLPEKEVKHEIGGSFGIDISSSKYQSVGGRKYWKLV